jgi:hypothetical protein
MGWSNTPEASDRSRIFEIQLVCKSKCCAGEQSGLPRILARVAFPAYKILVFGRIPAIVAVIFAPVRRAVDSAIKQEF